MKSVILGLLVALMVTPAFAAGRSRRVYQQSPQNKVYSIPTVGKTTYTVENPAVVKPTCKNGKCSLRR